MKTNFSIAIPVWLDKIFAWPVIFYRLVRHEHPYRKIPLGQNLYALVDPADYYWLNAYHWSARRNGICVYAVRFQNDSGCKPKIISMHREIMNSPKGLLVDHRNNVTFDNRRYNLRVATHSQNQYNKAKTKSKTSSRFIGVYKEKHSSFWCSKISHNGKSIWLGRFKSEIVAAKAYDRAALIYHKEFARLNNV